MALDPRIILAGRSPDIVGSLDAGAIAGQRARQFTNQNALNAYVGQNGPDIMSGNQNALNGLSNFGMQGLEAAQGVQSHNLGQEQARLGMDATRQGMQATAQRMRILDEQQAAQVRAEASALSAQELEQQRETIRRAQAVVAQATTPAAWDAAAEANGMPQLVGGFDARDQIIATLMDTDDLIASLAPPDPMDAIRLQTAQVGLDQSRLDLEQDRNPAPPAPADEYGRYAAEERAAGRQPLGRIDYAQAKKGEGVAVTTADGTTIRVGGASRSDPTSPSSPEAMIASIDGILNDPALDTATGIFSPLQALPGTPQRRFGARADQLAGQAFLQAFDSLKGAGQITEIEGQKATQAIGRLDTAQSADDYRQALTELRDILSTAARRSPAPPVPPGAALSPTQWQDAWDNMSDEDRALFQ